MKRLNQLVTRLLIVALVALAAWVGRAQLGKQAMIYHLQSFVGARVDARDLHLNGSESAVLLDQLEIANPLNERENLLQFEAGSLKLDFEQLKYRRLVIDHGRLSEIKVGAPRTTSGKLSGHVFDSAMSRFQSGIESPSPAGIPLSSDRVAGAYPAAKRWRDSLVVELDRKRPVTKGTFEVGPLLHQKAELWVERFREPSQQLADVNGALEDVEELLTVPIEEQNPLRSGTRIKDAIAKVNSSLSTLEQVGLSIAQYESSSQKDIYELSQVQMRDRQSLLTNEQTQKFDSKLVNELLVGEIQRQLVANGLEWFQQFRTSLPNPETDFRPIKRGRDITFGVAPKPKLEIKNLEIDGSAEFAKSHFKFAGTIENVVDDPNVSELPLKFNLRAQGDPQVVVAGVVDRTAGRKADSIEFTGHAIPQPAYTLGSKESIQVSMTGNSRLFVEADLHANELDQVSGTIKFTFEDVMLHADSVHEVAGGAETAARLNETVSGINTFRVTSTLGGTIQQPTTAFVSDLGPQVASSLEAVFRDARQLVQRKREHKLNQTIEGDLAQFKQNVAGGIAKLNESWRASYSRLNRLKKELSVASGPRFKRDEGRRR